MLRKDAGPPVWQRHTGGRGRSAAPPGATRIDPDAFGSRGLEFAATYLAMQILRAGFIVWAFGIKDTMGRNYAQLLAWSVIAGLFWIAGGLIHGHDARLAVWALAAVIVLAVAVHMAIVHPNDGVQPGFAAVCLGGPALFLVGITLSKHWLGHDRPLPRVVGAALLALFGAVAAFSDRLAELGVATVVCVVLAAWAQIDGGSGAEPA